MTGYIILAIYIGLFFAAYFAVHYIRGFMRRNDDFNARKTVTFGDESAIKPDRAASIFSILVIFLIWGAFTGSKWVPFHVPGPFIGETGFDYTVKDAEGQSSKASVHVAVSEIGEKPEKAKAEKRSEDSPFALDDFANTAAWRTVFLNVTKNDGEGAKVTAIDGQEIASGEEVDVRDGSVTMTAKGSLIFQPDPGLQMEPIWMPSPEAVLERFIEISKEGYQNFTLWEHLGWSLSRVLSGFFFGSLIGIPLGYAMGLSNWVRGWFDPIVEFMRPVPPLALIPLVIIWFGIWETGKVVLLFLAALWIMTIAARAGVSGVNITKVHAAYSLGANKRQVLWYVIVPNSLPEIFTGARVAMGVCWGTVVAAELVAAQKGAGMMIIAASKFQLTDIVMMGIFLIGIIGYGIDIAMRVAERILVPWQGKA
ncbi:taurine transport system permease protein [Cohaesibacter sp. ES.047]|uniref:ABC transporter permease subunit n=1 Tax=Cohaesibacter sp. ES.047 TaxID=1798205 RepID=UPI000BB742E9|nr:ABC transporter permease subunit [Cohaesibacter sp. ES.047]SNY91355.1 taurine transport system permease protein [Cohaesibacter sp. ES.047]